jgi:2-keto-3-deoxy-L-rhamnonate aldolase RhmA
MNGQDLKQKLKAGDRIYGSAIISPSPKWPDVVNKVGLDFVFLDTEHIPLGRETLATMCQQYKALGLPAIVRTPSPDPYEATVVLDGGAAGVLAPYVETPEQVRALIGAVKYRPLKGQFLGDVLNGKQTLNNTMANYIKDRTQNNILAINIESLPAVERLEELLDFDGLDAVFIGPHDLSCSMGLPEQYSHPEFQNIVKKIITVCRNKNVGVGIHLSEGPELQVMWANKGTNIVIHSSDISMFSKAIQHDINFIKKELGDVGVSQSGAAPII